MALGNVFMTDVDGNINIKQPPLTEMYCGLLFDISAQKEIWSSEPGSSLVEKLKDTVVRLDSMEDVAELGLTPRVETGETKNLLAGIPYYHIKSFFDTAAPGSVLYIAFADCTSGWGALIDMQKAADGMINQFGVWTEQELWGAEDSGAYSLKLVGDIQTVADSMANEYFSPACVLLSANTSRNTGVLETPEKIVVSKIPSCKIDARYVSVLLSQNAGTVERKMQSVLKSTTPVGMVGYALGTLTKAKVSESIAWVEQFNLRGSINSIEFGFGDAGKGSGSLLKNSTPYASLSKAQLNTLDDKGYIFLCSYEGFSGSFYFNKDNSCSEGDFCTISRNRTINKSRRLVRGALLPYVNSPVKVDPANGNISAAQATIYRNTVSDVLVAMGNAGEISSVGVVNVPVNQNILVTKTLSFAYSLIPLGCAEAIKVQEGLAIKR